MTIEPLSFCLGAGLGHILAIATVYLTAVCVRRVQAGRTIEPALRLRRPLPAPGADDGGGNYVNHYNGKTAS